jgi:hypothetical protein
VNALFSQVLELLIVYFWPVLLRTSVTDRLLLLRNFWLVRIAAVIAASPFSGTDTSLIVTLCPTCRAASWLRNPVRAGLLTAVVSTVNFFGILLLLFAGGLKYKRHTPRRSTRFHDYFSIAQKLQPELIRSWGCRSDSAKESERVAKIDPLTGLLK